ncbi:RNA recognition motif, partial [Trifolium medium]|nr:RNA recognition motif [Trifolium medium]
AKFGRVGEVYIPRKLDKRGNRFGFVKFKDVKNLEELSNQLSDVWCGSFKIRINIAKFNRIASPPKVVPAVIANIMFFQYQKKW